MDSSSRQPRKWTPEEDQVLRQEVEAQLNSGDVRDWCRIADQLPGRTNKDCRKRWHNSVAGGLKKGQWSKSEDELLTMGVEQYGQKWTLVATCVTSRSADQCAKRWQQSLDPDLDRSEWLELEDNTLIEATQRLGRHWKDIQREHFPGRSKNCIKNRYTVLVRRYQNQGIQLPDAASSPSDTSTPVAMSGYPEDGDYFHSAPHLYTETIPAPPQAPAPRSRNSWSSMDNDGYATWSTTQGYNIPTSAPDMYHTMAPLPHYALSHPPVLCSNAPRSSSPSDWTPSPVHSAMPSHTSSPDPSGMQPPFYGYGHYSSPEPQMMTYDPIYTTSTARSSYTSLPQQASPMVHRSTPSREHLSYAMPSLPASYHQPHFAHSSPYY